MGIFDDIGAVLENVGGAKDEAVDQVGQHLEGLAPDLQNPVEGVQDTVQSFGENLPGQDEPQKE